MGGSRNNKLTHVLFQSEEWQQFQSDLLMTVRVANDFKTEAQLAHEQLVLDNKTQRDKIRQLEAQLEKLNKSEYLVGVWTFGSFS